MTRKVLMALFIALLMGIAGFILTGCGDAKQVGTWYDTTNPDGDTLTITEDQTFIWDDVGGTWSESDTGILLMPNDAFSDSEELTLTEYDGEIALEEDDGTIWVKDYDKAYSIYEQIEAEAAEQQRQQQEEAEAAENDRKESAYKALKDSLSGKFYLNGSSDSDYIEFNNGTYEYHCIYDDGEETQSGTYELREEVNTNYSMNDDYYYSIEFSPDNTTSALSSSLEGKAFIEGATLRPDSEYGSENGKIKIEGSSNYYGESDEEGFMVDDGPYISENELSESELELF